MFRRGILFLIAGPSGVGKDSLIDGARRLLDSDISFWIPQRYITHPADSVGECHRPVTLEQFERMEQAQDFMLSWRAHGHAYGVPAAVEDALARGRSVIVNVSRSVIEQARRRWRPIRIMRITAPAALLRQRLEARGRETEDEIAARIEQADTYEITGEDVREVSNAGTPEQAIARFVALLEHEVLSSIAQPEKVTVQSE